MRKGRENACIAVEITDHDGGLMGGQVIGINLGWDFCAEHEFGIKGLNRAFGLPDKPERCRSIGGVVRSDLVGANSRTVTKVPGGLLKFFKNLNGYAYLLFTDSFGWMNDSDLTAERFDQMLKARGDEELSTAWSDQDFGVRHFLSARP